jgi:uncharacterized protein YjlB
MKRANTNPHIWNFIFKRNKYFPNNRLPVLIYRKVLELPKQKNKAAKIIQQEFLRNGLTNSWRYGIYDFHHYHSNTHECMGICMGSAFVILGGPNGRRVKLEAGDVMVLPAGVGHRCTSKTEDFLCVGAYPEGKDYDTHTGTPETYKETAKTIKKLSVPSLDPVFGEQGFLKTYWKK